MPGIRSTTRAKAAAGVFAVCTLVATATTIDARYVDAINSNTPGCNPREAAAAADGRIHGEIVFTSDRAGNNTRTIWSMNPDGSNPTQLTHKPSSSSYVYDTQPRWSPDGTRITFRSFGRGTSDGNSSYIMNADGGDVQPVL